MAQLKRENPALKLLISVGGDAHEGAHRFSRLVDLPVRRRQFIESAVEFCDRYGFDGVDLHWAYPGAEEFGGKPTDKTNFKVLLEELRTVLKSRDLLLTVAVPASRYRLDEGYDILALEKMTDFVNLQAFELYRSGHPVVGHHSVLRPGFHDHGLDSFSNVVGVAVQTTINSDVVNVTCKLVCL